MHISKLSKFWHQLSSFITPLWAVVNYKFIQLVDLKISCGCIPGFQARKGLHTGTVKIDPHKFCHLKYLCKSYSYIWDLSKTLIFRQLKTKFGNSFIGFFQTRKLTIKWHLSENRIHFKIREKYKTITCWKVWKY